jgi:stearoyl-CoA desaturase (delta-9 desaturase)
VLVALALTHVTIASVTIFLHRAQAHRALDLHPAAGHFFRFWLWLTTGIVTREWVAIHRKHHAKCETPEDPHSPQVLGIRKVLLEGAELYRAEAKNRETLVRYGRGTPDDWLERNLYTPHSAARHRPHAGHRPDPVRPHRPHHLGRADAVDPRHRRRHHQRRRPLLGLPQLHLRGRQHQHPALGHPHRRRGTPQQPPRLRQFGQALQPLVRVRHRLALYPHPGILGLASVKKVAPRVRWGEIKHFCDADLLHAIITHRYDVLTRYSRGMKQAYAQELDKLRGALPDVAKVRRWLNLDQSALKPTEKAELLSVLAQSERLKTLYQMRQELTALWSRSTASSEQLVRQLQDWCQKAESSGIEALSQFSRRLRCYA